MSKSTPLANLPNLKKQGPSNSASEQHENQIVKEILSEIDNSSGSAPHQPPADAQPSAEEQAMLQQQIQQQMMEQQLMEEQMHQQQMQQEMPQVASEPSAETLANTVAKTHQLSFVESLMVQPKPTVLVALIVALLSLPFVGNTVNKLLESKESLQKFALPLLLAIKGVIGGGVFFAANNAGLLN